ncbi:uncharacterized protein LOC110770898 [Prunus avium]|uniref:Uncharacterized protein LOC110770898 n=1 Tax=Prunus avium TaxID=42229 RepID=A0A6P5TVI6_PRUAV|nr:uncharacterized protein LOC110770898 [Prunus avium]
MGGSMKASQSKKVVWPSRCEASKHMDEAQVADTLEGADPSSVANKVAVKPEEPATELTKENESSQEQIQAQDGLDDALKRRLQQLIDSNRVMLFMKGTPEDPKCEFSKMAVNMLKRHEVEFGSFDLLTDNEVMEGIQKYSNWPLLPHIYFEGRARGFRHIGTLMKDDGEEPVNKEVVAISENCSLLTYQHYWITSKDIVMPNRVIYGAVEVKEGKIASIVKEEEKHGKAKLENLIDYGEAVVMPGMHILMILEELNGKDFHQGGITTLVDMPLNSDPSTVSRETLELKIKAAESRIYIDVGFWGGLVPENTFNASALEDLLNAGVLGLKDE